MQCLTVPLHWSHALSAGTDAHESDMLLQRAIKASSSAAQLLCELNVRCNIPQYSGEILEPGLR